MPDGPSPLPASLRIGPYTWQIRCSKKDWKKTKPSENHVGSTDLEKMQIDIKPGFENLEYERATLWHEIMHAARYSAGQPVDHNDPEESFVQMTDAILLQTLHDNPDLLDYLGLT